MDIRAVINLLEGLASSPAETFCGEVEQAVDRARIEVMIHPTSEMSAHLESIYAHAQRQGHGTEAMRLIVALADKHGVTLTLEIEEDDDEAGEDGDEDSDAVGSSALMSWYLGFGFEVTGSTGWRLLMQRQPSR